MNLDGKLALKRGIVSVFQAWDIDGSGTISLPELKTVLAEIGVNETDVPKLFSLADCNKDGQIDYEEFVSWLSVVAPVASAQAPRAAVADAAAAPPPVCRAAERGGHPDMTPLGLSKDEPEIRVTCKLAAPVCPHLDFTIKVTPSTAISEIASRVCENHGGSISHPAICVGRFHPAEIRSHSTTLKECGILGGDCAIYYDFVAQAGGVLA